MKKIFSLVTMAMLVLSVMPVVFAQASGGIGADIVVEDSEPNIWMCDSRAVIDDNLAPGRITLGGDPLAERTNNYAFEGEQIQYTVLVEDANGIQKISDVYGTIGTTQHNGVIEVNCVETVDPDNDLDANPADVDDTCNAMIDGVSLGDDDFNPDTMRYYQCTFTVEAGQTGDSWFTVEVEDLDGNLVTVDENENWFLNPLIALSIDGASPSGSFLNFPDGIRPGTSAYSDTISLGNDAEAGSGVLLDMFISGTDFYDSASSGAACPTTNQLALTNFAYYAVNGAYNTVGLTRTTGGAVSDSEGYLNIPYATGFNQPNPFYGFAEIIPTAANNKDDYSLGNVLSPGAEMSLTFRLDLPAPCNGDFDTGSINFWGEAI